MPPKRGCSQAAPTKYATHLWDARLTSTYGKVSIGPGLLPDIAQCADVFTALVIGAAIGASAAEQGDGAKL
jgi:hypothetical protein